MVQKKESKTAALLIAALVFLASFIYIPDWSVIGVFPSCPPWQRLFYPFFHASPIHALINAWCLLSAVFLFNPPLWRLVVAYLIAVIIPDCCLTSLSLLPTVGLSVLCFALIGQVSLLCSRRIYFSASILAFIAVGFLFPSVNAWAHLYGYLAGLFVGVLTIPLSCLKRK